MLKLRLISMCMSCLFLLLLNCSIECSSAQQGQDTNEADKRYKSKNETDDKRLKSYLKELYAKDTCGSIFFSKKHGFDLKEYRITTQDNYVLKLHRLIHPSDFTTSGPKLGTKKPYILLHGLIGSSGSFLRNIDLDYKTTETVFDKHQLLEDIQNFKADNYEHKWQSVADKFDAAYEGDKSAEIRSRDARQKLSFRYSNSESIDYDGDAINFGREFKQAYRKFEFSPKAKPFISNSLAFTLSNFGYDVWLINLRGNSYSRATSGTLNPDRVEYWNFDIDTLVREDLLASLNKVKQITGWTNEPMGLISYSYSGLHVLELLTKFPIYQTSLQPVIMMAPTLLNSYGQSKKFKYFMKIVTKTLVANNGPFPDFGRSKHSKVEHLICRLPVTSSLCRLIETLLYGRAKSLSIPKIIISDHQTRLIKQDTECGQTSIAVLHEIIDNLSNGHLKPKYNPSIEFKKRFQRSNGTEKLRRSVMLIRSQDDNISTPFDVEKIKDTALKSMTLVDINVKEPNFDHTDFLFSKKNQYLVNAEIARMAIVFDFLLKSPSANKSIEQARGF